MSGEGAEPSADFWEGRKVVVTGGSGFLGSEVTGLLGSLGADVSSFGSADFDLVDPGEAVRALDGTEIVIHLAANVGGIGYNRRNPAPLVRDNLLMGTNVFEAARVNEVERLVAVASVCSYPSDPPVPFSEQSLWDGYPEGSNAPYGLAKRMLPVLSDAYRRQYDLDSSVPVVANLYGPRDNFDLEDSHVIPAMIAKFESAAQGGESEVVLWGTGNPSREFLYVEDAARGIVMAAERDVGSEPFNLGTGVETRIADLAEKVAEATGFEGEIVWDASRPDGQAVRYLDVSRARELLGFAARIGLDEGLARTIAWYRDTAFADS